jgi:UTP--glucose-1-phosphate uridylyltransferase
MPKELLPIIDKPVIQFAVEEAIEADITDLIFVTGRTKRAIEDHFDGKPELEGLLARTGKDTLLEQARSIIPKNVNCIFVRQAQALGLGHAIFCARPAVSDEPFAVLLPDDLMVGSPRPTKDLVQHFERTGRTCISVTRVTRESLENYGVVRPVTNVDGNVVQIS